MNRVWDYIGFAVWFAGLGYIGLWLVGSPDYLALPPALHAFGGGAAAVRAACDLIIARRQQAPRRGRRHAGRPRRQARRKIAAAAAQGALSRPPGQTAQPFRPARHAGMNRVVA